MLNDKVLAPEKNGPPSSAVIILHGLGDNASGIIGLGEAWRRLLPETVFLAPDAPFACPYALGGFQWFGAEDWRSAVVLKGVKAATPYLIEYIDNVLARYALEANSVALVGFSQGSMMSLYVGPRFNKKLAGILSYSGALVGEETLGAEKKHAPPVLLAHGTADDVVSFSYMGNAEKGLQKAEIPVRSVSCQGLGHGVDEKGLKEGALFLRSILKTP